MAPLNECSGMAIHLDGPGLEGKETIHQIRMSPIDILRYGVTS